MDFWELFYEYTAVKFASIPHDIERIGFYINVLRFSRWQDLLSPYPIYIFHHIQKCGGSSARYALRNWFFVRNDYRRLTHEEMLRDRLPWEHYSSRHCIAGHFEHHETFLHIRYPEFIGNPDFFRIFTFMRDPLQMSISHYYYYPHKRLSPEETLESWLLRDTVELAKSLPCTMENYLDVMGRYFFIGLTERLQESMDCLARILHRHPVKVPRTNPSRRDDQQNRLSPEVLAQFREKNAVDYLVYEEAVRRCEASLRESSMSVAGKEERRPGLQ